MPSRERVLTRLGHTTSNCDLLQCCCNIRCPDKDGEKPEVSDYHKTKIRRNLGKYDGAIFGRPR
jgi:hypothetical protein